MRTPARFLTLALTGVFAAAGQGPEMVDKYLEGIARPFWDARTKAVAGLRTPDDVARRQSWARDEFIRLMGGLPDKSPLNPRITRTLVRDDYRIENLVFESLPKTYVTANVYIPRNGRAPYPAVLGAPGHTYDSKAEPNYQRLWVSLAKRGFVVIAFDPLSQGERIIHYDPKTARPRAGIASGEHTSVGLQCLLTGTSIARYFVWDGIRALDYLLTRPEVDPARIAIAGVSGGGMQAAYLALVEPRLAASGPSCWMTSTEKSFVELGPQDAEQNVMPLAPSGLGVEDFALGFAPRPFSYFTATRDFFPIAGARTAFAESRRIYEIMGSPGNVEFHEYDDGHGWSKPRREATYRWLQKVLNGRPDDTGEEPDFPVEPPAALHSTLTGHLATSLGGENAYTLNRSLAERLTRRRPQLDAAALTSAVRSRLAFKRLPAPSVDAAGPSDMPGYTVEKLVLRTEPGILVPALLFLPAAAGRKPAVLYVHPEGKAADAGDIPALTRAGHVVLAPDLRAMGESAASSTGATEGHTNRYKTAMRALHVARPLAGMQVADLLACFDYLTTRPEVDPQRIAVFGKGNGGVIALYAALLEPRLRKVAAEASLVSYLDLARAGDHRGFAGIVIPGVLKDFDLPEVARAIAPRTVWLVDPVVLSGSGEDTIPARHRPAGSAFDLAYSDWLRW